LARLRYKFNPDTLLFEITRTSKWKKTTRVVRGFLFSLVLTVGYYLIYTQYFDMPRSLSMRRDNADMVVKYDLLNKRFQEASEFLSQMQRRDNNVYRATFGLDIIPSSVRDAGFGGTNRYSAFEKSEYAATLINASRSLDILLKKAYVQSISLDDIAKSADRIELMVDCIPAVQPIALRKNGVRITSLFGRRTDPVHGDIRPHKGVDFAGPLGTPIFSTGNGVVKEIKRSYSYTGYGNYVVIDHGFGYTTYYAHLQTIKVVQGQIVTRGDQIGTLGSTGKSTAPHLHYEVRYLGEPQNPMNYFSTDLTAEEYDEILRTAQENKNYD